MSQITRGAQRRLMYVECKGGEIDGAQARIGWVEFSKTGRTIYYRDLSLAAIGGRGTRGNFLDPESGLQYWVSGVKARGSNSHPAEGKIRVEVDEDARVEYASVRAGP